MKCHAYELARRGPACILVIGNSANSLDECSLYHEKLSTANRVAKFCLVIPVGFDRRRVRNVFSYI
jgi:hypothetical protein